MKGMTKAAKERLIADFNPLLQFWKNHDVTQHAEQLGSTLSFKIVQMLNGRAEAVDNWSWAIPSELALSELVSSSPIVEVGAGTGYWASLLASMGADVIAYDVSPPGIGIANVWHPGATKVHFPIRVGDAEAAANHSDRTLFMCWPPKGDMAFRAASAWDGERLIVVGEPGFETCADKRFRDLLVDRFTLDGTVQIPQWTAIGDAMSVWVRRRAA